MYFGSFPNLGGPTGPVGALPVPMTRASPKKRTREKGPEKKDPKKNIVRKKSQKKSYAPQTKNSGGLKTKIL
ncbi:MAG: hypothetical protein EBZ77_03640 [Chitinophagia bacterium]|nr:hypothetical protein [Chitinophagia bacterium]